MPTNEQTGKSKLATADAERKRCECCDKGKIWEADWTGSQHERDCTECMGTGIVQDKKAVDRSAVDRELIAAAKVFSDYCACGHRSAGRCAGCRLRAAIAAWEATKA